MSLLQSPPLALRCSSDGFTLPQALRTSDLGTAPIAGKGRECQNLAVLAQIAQCDRAVLFLIIPAIGYKMGQGPDHETQTGSVNQQLAKSTVSCSCDPARRPVPRSDGAHRRSIGANLSGRGSGVGNTPGNCPPTIASDSASAPGNLCGSHERAGSPIGYTSSKSRCPSKGA